MINKFFKRILNRQFKSLSFFLMLKYIIVLLIVIAITFFSIPKFFDFQKKQNLIESYLLDKYALELSNINSIQYKVFPFPNLTLKNVKFGIEGGSIKSATKNLKIYLNFKNILSLKDFSSKRLVLMDTNLNIEIENYKNLLNYMNELQEKLKIKNLDLNFRKDGNLLFKLEDINISNYGYKKNNITGKIFEKKFKINFKNKKSEINFKILNTGIKADFFLKQDNLNSVKKGMSKIIVANNLFKFDFEIDDNHLVLSNAYIKNKVLSANFNSIIEFSPFFYISSDIEVKEIGGEFFNKINLNSLIFENKAFIKKLNIKNKVKYKSKKFDSNLINNFSTNLDLAYGRLTFQDKTLISGGENVCKGEINLIDEFPRVDFICNLKISNKKKFFKQFSIKKNFEKDNLHLYYEGSLNLISKKINFRKIELDGNLKDKNEDLKYFKDIFERILFNENFFGIFKEKKIKELILEII